MSREHYLFEEFIRIVKMLNRQLNIVPVLFGSLGLSKVAEVDFSPDDIDILIPLIYLEDDWGDLEQTMGKLGYTLVDLDEHEFNKHDFKIGFSYIEDLKEFADVDYKTLETIEENEVTYQILTIKDYFKVYSKSLQDGYRRTKNNGKDLSKVEVLNKLVKE